MRLLPAALAVCIASLIAGPTPAQEKPPLTPDQVAERGYPKGIHWLGDVKAALEEAKERNCPIMVAFLAEHRGDQVVVEGLYQDKATISLTRKFVCLVACRARHDLVRDFGSTGRMKNVCKRFGGCSCSEHQRVERWAFMRFSKKNSIVTPQHVFLDADGRELSRIVNDLNVTAEMFHAIMLKAIERVGPGVSAADRRHMQNEVAAAEKRIAGRDYPSAISALLAVVAAAGKSQIGSRARALLERVEKAAVAELNALDTLIAAGDFAAARDLATASAQRFKGVNAAKLFQDRLQLLHGRGSGKSAKAARLLERAEKAFAARRYADAEAGYRKIVLRCGTTPAAARARARLEAFRNDPELARALAAARAEADCTTWMRTADALRANGRTSAARDYYQRIVKTYPDSRHAAAARAKLAKL